MRALTIPSDVRVSFEHLGKTLSRKGFTHEEVLALLKRLTTITENAFIYAELTEE